MQVRRLTEIGLLHFVAPAVAAFADVQRLVKVADDVDDEAKRRLLVGEAGRRVLKYLAKVLQGLERVALTWRLVVDDSVERDEVPGRRRLLPVFRGVGSHLVRPVGGIDEVLAGPEALADVCQGEAAKLGL